MSRPLRTATGEPVVIDSSVAFKWFDTSEYGAEEAARLLDAHAADEIALVAPAHLPLEVANAASTHRVPLPQLLEVAKGLAAADLLLAPLDDGLLVDSLRIAHEDGHSLYDAVFIALASRLDCELVTADHRQASTKACRVRLIG